MQAKRFIVVTVMVVAGAGGGLSQCVSVGTAPAKCDATNCSLTIGGPATVASGGMVTFVANEVAPAPDMVTWLVNGIVGGAAATGTITADGVYTAPATNQNLTFAIGATTALGLSALKAITVTPPVPPTVTLSASPAIVAPGATSTLTWSTTNATSCTASGAWNGTQTVNGTATVLPSGSSSTYTLSCTGAGGQGQASTTVNVVAPPTVTLTPSTVAGVPISPTSAGEYDVPTLTNIDLNWTATNAKTCSASWTSNAATSGTAHVRTANTYNLGGATYTITCAGVLPATSATASLPLSIWAPVTVTLASTSTTLAPGDSATLRWSSRFANACTSTGWPGSQVGGTSVVSPTQTTVYSVQCTGPAGSTASASTTLNVSATPIPGVQLAAVPTIVLPGETSTLTWTSTHATSCTASSGFSTGQQANGTASVSPAAATTYTVTCTGPNGTATASTKVAVTSEPVFPAVCATVPAQVPVLLPQEEINPSLDSVSEVQRETQLIASAFTGCPAGSAVELTAGSNGATGFLLAPLTVPAGNSLLVDGGVTVFGTSNVDLYYPSTGSLSLINLGDKSGLYGYGVIDGRGYSTMIGGGNPGSAWWDQIYDSTTKTYSLPARPFMVFVRGSATFYKITLRNSPNWHIRVEGNDTSNLVLWGVKVQAPWNAPNTDGIDVYSGNSSTIAYSSFAGGDDNIALDSDYYPLNNVLIDHIHAYGRNGLSLGSHTVEGMSNITIQNVSLNADPQSFTVDSSQNLNSIDGQTVETLKAQNPSITAIDQAVMTAHIPVPGLNIKFNDPMGPIDNLLWRNICMRGIVSPITINPYLGAPSTGLRSPAWMTGMTYQNIRVMPSALPANAVPKMGFGFTNALNGPAMNLTLDNVVVDSASGASSNIGDIYAQQANFQLSDTVYPLVFGKLNQPNNTQIRTTVYGTYTVLQDVTATGTASSTPAGAYTCPADAFVDTVGELYASTPSATTGNKLIASSGTVSSAAATTLTAVISPARAEKTYFAVPSIWTANLVAVGAPHLSGSVLFCDGSTQVGTVPLGMNGNGTVAQLPLTGLQSGSQHTYTAQYSPSGAALSCQVAPVVGSTVVGPVVLNVQ